MDEEATASEQRELQREATDCPVVRILEAFAADIRSLRDAGTAIEVITAPYCDPRGLWRAELRGHCGGRSLVWCGLMNHWKTIR